MSCGLFVAEVRGSRSCAVCKRDIREHDPRALYVEPRRIFPELPPLPAQNMTSLATSENSAFTPYARPSGIPSIPKSSSSSTANVGGATSGASSVVSTTAAPPPLIRPTPRLAVPHSASNLFAPNHSLPQQEDRSDSCIYKKIRGKRKERSCSVGELRSPSPAETEDDQVRTSCRASPIPTQRSNDFKKILQRFQSADQSDIHVPTPNRRSTIEIYSNSNSMSPAHDDAWSSSRCSRDEWSPVQVAPRDTWSPAQRSSQNSGYRNSVGSRNTSARSRHSLSSLQSPLSFLPTRECSPRSAPSPSLIPLRNGILVCEDDRVNSAESHSPLSHTGSTPEPQPESMRKPLQVTVPIPKRRSLPGRWIKETDVDAPCSLPMTPLSSPSITAYSQEDLHHKSVLNSSKSCSPEENQPIIPLKPKFNGRYSGSCRRVLSGLENNNQTGPNGVYVRRSRSKDDRPITTYNARPAKSFSGSGSSISRGTRHNIPVFMSAESVNSPQRSPSPPKSIKDFEYYKHFQQISLNHVQTLSMVADRLADDLRRGEEPVSRNRMSNLDFSHFVISPQPVLTKGKSLFYNAVLPRQGQVDYPATLMIAPCSQYAPLMRRGDSQLFGVPGFLEMEDHDGGIRRFLETTGTHNLDGRRVKVIAMPRQSLCSFHSLAAHHLNERMDRTSHEELVCFILLQLMAALKMLQSEGIEALSANFKEFLLAYRFSAMDSQTQMRDFPRLIFLSETLGAEVETGSDELVGLCRYALRALCTLLHHRMDGRAPPIKLRSRFSRALQACANLLAEDKSSSLTKAKNVLELALWWNGDAPRSETDCRRSIDTSRAECIDVLLRQLICDPGCRMGPKERLRVEFLLTATPRSLIDSQKAVLSAHVS
ncbi:unnamed protein product [Auanema sp. JU1783]|nr:unnamed protein product [Auanema sp. JU1783]